jgi:hypothetical protein
MTRPLPKTVPYTLLQARGVESRSDELMNVGIVLHLPGEPLVALSEDTTRLRALHPDYAALNMAGRAQGLQSALRELGANTTADRQHSLLWLVARPFTPAGEAPALATLADDPSQTLAELMQWLVLPPGRTLRPIRGEAQKRPTRLVHEIRTWLRSAKAFSAKVDDISRGKVVANYPIDPSADLFADFAVLNGKLNAIETLDLRGVDRLTPTLRGDAALKGVTLDEARQKMDGRRVVVLSATDYGVARPAIQLISRYADDVWDMHNPTERQKLAEFIAGALHRDGLPGLQLAG